MRATRKQLAVLRSLRRRKGRREAGLFLVEGLRLCEELSRTKRRAGVAVESVLLSEEHAQGDKLGRLAWTFRETGVPVLTAPAHEVQRISDTKHSQGVLAAARWCDTPLGAVSFSERAIIVALDRVSDPGNVGTTIRTAAWFRASAVLLGEGCADLLNAKTVRATMGGLFHLPVCRGLSLADALDRLHRLGFSVTVAATDGSPDWRAWATPRRSVLVLGSEAHGVSGEVRERADRVFAIPRRGAGESLNVAVSAGVFLSAVT